MDRTQPHKLLSVKLGELLRKIWNPINFKGHVSPAEFMEAVSVCSQNRFKCDMKSKDCQYGGSAEPSFFLAWLLSSLTERRLVDRNLQGELTATTLTKGSDETEQKFD